MNTTGSNVGPANPTLMPADLNERILESVPAGVIHISADGVMLRANAEALRILDMSWDELRRQHVRDFEGLTFHEDGSPCSAEEYPVSRCLATGQPQLAMTIGVRLRSGLISWGVYSAIPVMDVASGRVTSAVVTFLDVTDKLERRAALQRERDFISAVLDTVGALVVVLARDGRIVRFNGACVELSGYTADEACGMKFWDFLLPPEDVGEIMSVWDRLMTEMTPLKHENDWVTRDGQRRRIAWTNTVVTNVAGEVDYVIGTGIDVTRERAAEAEVRHRDALFESLIDNLPFDVWARDMDDRCIVQNGFSRERWGDQRGQTPDKVTLPPEILTIWRAHNAQARSGQAVRAVMQYTHAGELRYYDKILAPIRDGQTIRGTVGVNIDITQSKQVEEALRRSHEELEQRVSERTSELLESNRQLELQVSERVRAETRTRESEERLRAIVDNTTAVIYMKDLAGRYMMINRQFEELFHVTRADVVGKTDLDLFPRETAEGFMRNDRRVAEADRVVEFEEQVPHDDGIVHTYISIKMPLHNGRGRCYAVCGISTDITDRRRADEQLRRHRDELAHSARLALAGQLAALMAHELSQPLNAIGNFASGCLNYMRSGTPSQVVLEQKIESVVAQAERAGRFVSRVHDLVRKNPTPRAAIRLNDPIRAAIEVLEPRLRERQARLTVDLCEPSPVVWGDTIQLEQVIINLLLNGLDAMMGMAPSERLLTVRSGHSPAGMAEFHVIDAGTGVSSDQAARIFEQFYTTREDGLGMGLPLCRGIMDSHNGRLEFTNNADRGATFRGQLPCVMSAS